VANAFVGAFIGLVCAALFGPSWNTFLAMLVGMAIGMLLSLPPLFGFVALFGAMEIMVPTMTTGMVAGMVVSMRAAGQEVGLSAGAALGAQTGLLVIAVIYLVNVIVKRRVPTWTS